MVLSVRTRSCAAALVVTFLAAALTAGCSHSKTSPPHLTPTSPTKPTPPAVPADANANTRDAAGAFAKYWWGDLMNYSFNSLDTSQLTATSSPSCVPCKTFIDSINQAKTAGGRFEGGNVQVLESAAAPFLAGSPIFAAVLYNATASRQYDKDGKVVRSSDAVTNSSVQVYLEWDKDHWLAKDLRSVK